MTGSGLGRLRIGACLSLSGRHARFGRQARAGLESWASWAGTAEPLIEDDQSDPDVLETDLRGLAGRCDILLGPYSTHLMRRAGAVAAELGLLVWNHGGSGDDVEAAHPGNVVSVLTPASRYAEPFLHHVAGAPEPLWIVHGRGGFGRQMAAGAAATARALGIDSTTLGPGDELPISSNWHLLCAASFEEDVDTIIRARNLPAPPRTICAVAAGVRAFGDAITEPAGVYGVGQWFPGGGIAELGPAESDFLTAYERQAGTLPDYPAVQAAATATIAAHCVTLAGTATRAAVWSAASALDTTTLFGRFAIDPASGVQTGHRPVLVRWTATGPARAG
jgi:ABC-type branched-subunit amino acid transport system substrate-binding protein